MCSVRPANARSQPLVPRNPIAHYQLLVSLARLARIYCLCVGPCILRDALSLVPKIFPQCLSSVFVGLGFGCLNCISSSVASRNFNSFAASAGVTYLPLPYAGGTSLRQPCETRRRLHNLLEISVF